MTLSQIYEEAFFKCADEQKWFADDSSFDAKM
ncbi:hypothetical protein N185_16240 [Sinorhizobium sp. GW3]|nr:hypothetical protein N185_16240 [Sinorhizobium sp. GW3]